MTLYNVINDIGDFAQYFSLRGESVDLITANYIYHLLEIENKADKYKIVEISKGKKGRQHDPNGR
jgi:hypothetical protein